METRQTSSGSTSDGWADGAEALAAEHKPEPTSNALPAMLAVEEQPLTAEDCAIGEVLCGRYRVEGVIGRGSMGVVVAATHLGFDELVAIKFIRPEMRKAEGIVSRFAREAKASVRIRNAHVVNVLDVDVTDPIGPFFAMEYLWGSNLEELIDARGPLGVATATHYVLQACEGLAAAHAQGIIHRDLKPQNMFLARQGTLESIKILDFGISKAPLSGQVFGDDLSLHEHELVMGTPLYMSPEQLRHTPDLDERTDIWSLGAVLYELLSGEPPFAGDTHSQVARQVLEPAHAAISVALEGVPDELCQVIERCLSRDRDQRFDNVAELARALLPFAPTSARLHLERAMALLGLEVTEVCDEDIEDLEWWPLEEPSREVSANKNAGTSVAPPRDVRLGAPSRRRPQPWLELMALLLVCAGVGLVAQYFDQAPKERAVLHSTAPSNVQTEPFALQPREAVSPPETPVAAPEPQQPAAPEQPTPHEPSDGARPNREPATRAWARRETNADVHPPTQPSASSAPTTPERVASAPAPKRRTQPKPEAKLEAKPTFRLIPERPPNHFALLPASARSSSGMKLVAPD